MSPRWNRDSPTPLAASECALPLDQRVGGHTRLRLKGWGSPNSNDWRNAQHSAYSVPATNPGNKHKQHNCGDFYYIQAILNQLLQNKLSTTSVRELGNLFLTMFSLHIIASNLDVRDHCNGLYSWMMSNPITHLRFCFFTIICLTITKAQLLNKPYIHYIKVIYRSICT